ncbi:inner membrane protein [Schizosaccharomyces cryophilus OY26]|uniref:Inner membrane protein n=1 Tax=Schizosaccharomyces cryophilus (strain OY26 / ATCC MYA-4695 / CBS 11777 / NBRC 106824 / NRRL Y48691) TaxID=653667 RepID=S9XHM0_SCHCR|nr:inner membrane protein [Schizosaccharomyces cryophilus OY26]EPY53176.1 inner membrane protein [Schizosaccharomyces cryophilus OY26]
MLKNGLKMKSIRKYSCFSRLLRGYKPQGFAFTKGFHNGSTVNDTKEDDHLIILEPKRKRISSKKFQNVPSVTHNFVESMASELLRDPGNEESITELRRALDSLKPKEKDISSARLTQLEKAVDKSFRLQQLRKLIESLTLNGAGKQNKAGLIKYIIQDHWKIKVKSSIEDDLVKELELQVSPVGMFFLLLDKAADVKNLSRIHDCHVFFNISDYRIRVQGKNKAAENMKDDVFNRLNQIQVASFQFPEALVSLVKENLKEFSQRTKAFLEVRSKTELKISSILEDGRTFEDIKKTLYALVNGFFCGNKFYSVIPSKKLNTTVGLRNNAFSMPWFTKNNNTWKRWMKDVGYSWDTSIQRSDSFENFSTVLPSFTSEHPASSLDNILITPLTNQKNSDYLPINSYIREHEGSFLLDKQMSEQSSHFTDTIPIDYSLKATFGHSLFHSRFFSSKENEFHSLAPSKSTDGSAYNIFIPGIPNLLPTLFHVISKEELLNCESFNERKLLFVPTIESNQLNNPHYLEMSFSSPDKDDGLERQKKQLYVKSHKQSQMLLPMHSVDLLMSSCSRQTIPWEDAFSEYAAKCFPYLSAKKFHKCPNQLCLYSPQSGSKQDYHLLTYEKHECKKFRLGSSELLCSYVASPYFTGAVLEVQGACSIEDFLKNVWKLVDLYQFPN